MRTPLDIYEQYRIMPGLQLHQLRVAAVAQLVCEQFAPPSGALDTRSIILAALFHDMGNIIKSDLTILPELREPYGTEYWQKVKDECIEKYGPNEHAATSAIVQEIGIPPEAIALIEGVGFSKMKAILAEEGHYERKIVEYGDCRVSPSGVVSIRERFEEGSKRYRHRHASTQEAEERYRALADAGYRIEEQLFSRASITPDDINDVSVAPVIETLKTYEVA